MFGRRIQTIIFLIASFSSFLRGANSALKRVSFTYSHREHRVHRDLIK